MAGYEVNTYVPNYYKDFKCIADECKHNCCIGWEIDIDDDTYEYYMANQNITERDLGRRFKTDIEPLMPHFKLGPLERCPFLNTENLCDIISVLGEESLCQICADHPRFRNFYETRTEIGLGLTCEAAADLIINNVTPFSLLLCDVSLEPKGDKNESEESFFETRNQIFSILQDEDWTFRERVSNLLIYVGIDENKLLKMLKKIKTATIVDAFESLEQLDPLWMGYLEKLRTNTNIFALSHINDKQLEQLLIYFLYRHLPDGLYDGYMNERIGFALLSTYMIVAVSNAAKMPLTEAARMYSSEIEYSDENVESLLEFIHKIK